MNPYRDIDNITADDVRELLQEIVRERRLDISDFNNLQNRFISGRKVNKIPAGASDVVSTDKVGDFNYDASYIYVLVNNSGTAEWRRAALSTW